MAFRFRRKCWATTTKVLAVSVLMFLTLQLVYLHSSDGNNLTLEQTRWISGASFQTHDKKATVSESSETSQQKTPTISVQHLIDGLQSTTCGKRRTRKGFLTIGIPSIRRPNTEHIYLLDTLDSLQEKISEEDYTKVTIVVMLSDDNETYNTKLSDLVYHKYQQQCSDGFINLIRMNKTFYPDLNKVKPTFNDSKSRLRWRAEQNLDFGLLMLHSRNMSDFYLQLEDDVLAATNFMQDIRTTITKTKQKWYLLEFSRLGFIGKLFHASDLEFSAEFLITKYQEAPGDLLLGAMRKSKGQPKPLHVNNSLFQHIGKFSSLKNKLMPSIDGTFKDKQNTSFLFVLPKGDNPPAKIATSLETYDDHVPEMAYDDDNSTFFWAMSPKKRSHFTMIFTKPHNFSRILISTGELGTKRDSFLQCDLLYSEAVDGEFGEGQECKAEFKTLVPLVDGDVDTLATGTRLPENIKCLRLLAKRNLKHWVIISDIQLFLK